MKALLDTHTFLWAINDPDHLSARVRDICLDGSNELFLSAASAWEIAIKAKLGKLRLPDAPERYIPRQLATAKIDVLPIQLSHALRTYQLPEHHRDPFDRLIVAQAQLEKLPILSVDPQLARYAVTVIW
jgi:PIN domain nuclease of toxin-antitoxin system